MRVLCTATAGVHKVFPLVPLAWAFRSAGHEVLVTTAEECEMAATTGLHIIDAAPGYDGAALLQDEIRRNPALAQIWLDALDDDPAPLAPAVAVLCRPLVERTMAVAEAWRPDLVVYEHSAPHGLIVAARLGVPAVQRNLGTIRTGRLLGAFATEMADVLDRYDITTLPQPAITLEYVPPSMLPWPEPEGWFMAELSYNGGAMLGDRLPRPPDRPRIVITMGTIRAGMHGLGPLEPVIAAAAKMDADFLLALGNTDPGPLGTLPTNVQPIGWTPLGALLKECTGIVHHGGGGTTMAAIDAGVPQLLALDPRYLGHKTMGPAVSKRGIGLVTSQDQIDVSMLERLVTDEALRTATAEVRAELAALPTPADTVRRITGLVTGG